MAITRSTWTDDDGSGLLGSVPNNAELQKLYDNIDAAIGGLGQLDLGTIANNGVASLSLGGTSEPIAAILVMSNQPTGGWTVSEWVMLRGTMHSTFLITTGSGSFSITAGTASKINVYWSAGNARYELENKSGQSLPIKVAYFKQF